MTSRNKIAIHNALEPNYPQQLEYNPMCPINQIYKTLPYNSYGSDESCGSDESSVKWERTAVGPASVKHLYSGIPNWYPIQTISRPVETMYGRDNSQFHKSGVGRGKRISYHHKVYPFTDRHVREVKDYANYMLPYPTWNDKNPVIRDANLNSSMQYQPYAYSSDK
jgi:hypothetical protein